MKLLRLSGRKVCERVKTKGFLWKGRHLHVRWMQGAPRTVPSDAPPAFYVGTLTSAKLDKSAVRRNRMRRRCREALRIVLKEHKENELSRSAGLAGSRAGATPIRERMVHGRKTEGLPSMSCQLLLFPRSSSLSADFHDILADVSHFLSSLSSCHQPKRNPR
jgi:ribonuclease P protein component